jgi:predicted ArsR family transcriptional regulator
MQSNEEIAGDFYISVNTVKAHLKALYRKLSVGTRRCSDGGRRSTNPRKWPSAAPPP